ncbi:MAG: ATP-binding protein [Bryobacteraceae bacterium]
MKFRFPPLRVKSVGVRISATCWFVTLLTLILYVSVNLPQQKRDLLEGLKSKAQGVSSSLQDVTAGAAMSEDYSTVVDHCIQILQGDDAIEYLVITKTDGFSVIVERNGWRIGNLDRFWRPDDRGIVAEIGYVPLVRKRVFRYSRPFDYSAIRWGWVNVGLSTAAYDRSVNTVHQRSAQLAILGAGLSLLISFIQAKRLVRPIIRLQDVVGQIERGDLSARAKLHTGDEIEDLANSFNSMADAILDRNRILEGVRFAGQQLLSADDWSRTITEVLAKIGQAAEVSRTYIFKNHTDAEGILFSTEQYEWTAPGIRSTRETWQNFRWQGSGLEAWPEQLSRGEIVVADLRRRPEKGVALDPSIRTLVLTPIRVGGAWWGVLGVSECARDREWGDAEKDSLQAVADMIGAAIARKRAKDALVDAKDNLEVRVLERTRELEEQVKAKEEANAQLAQAQQRLIELSREAGMAEVATGVLHNVGNVLNSVNVSATIVANKVRDSRVQRVAALADMLQQHSADLADYLVSDVQGQRILPYLSKLSSHLEEERQVMLRELDLLTLHVGHIKEIVATQQSYAKVSGLIEVISLEELAEDSIRICASGFERRGIRLERDYQPTPLASVDKHSVLQILLNLLRNANHALEESDNPDKRLRIRIYCPTEERIRVEVSDTGVGLPPENLTRIFSHGFTTRRGGHGFGLHSGANAAKQMGGTLWAESAGLGHGATFTLELPVKAEKQQKSDQQKEPVVA